MRVLLEDKDTVAYEGGGKVGGAVGGALAGEEAGIFLAGRTGELLEEVTEEIYFVGGVAETAWPDASGERRGEENASA